MSARPVRSGRLPCPRQFFPRAIASHCPRPLRGRGRRPEAGRGGGYEEGSTSSATLCGEGATRRDLRVPPPCAGRGLPPPPRSPHPRGEEPPRSTVRTKRGTICFVPVPNLHPPPRFSSVWPLAAPHGTHGNLTIQMNPRETFSRAMGTAFPPALRHTLTLPTPQWGGEGAHARRGRGIQGRSCTGRERPQPQSTAPGHRPRSARPKPAPGGARA